MNRCFPELNNLTPQKIPRLKRDCNSKGITNRYNFPSTEFYPWIVIRKVGAVFIFCYIYVSVLIKHIAMDKDIIKYNPIKMEIEVPKPNHVKSFIPNRAIPKKYLIPSE